MNTQTQVINPADMSDPTAQQKLAEGVLQQLGLHPNQSGARSLLDMHFQGPTANQEVAQTVKPLIGPGTSSAVDPATAVSLAPTTPEIKDTIPEQSVSSAPAITALTVPETQSSTPAATALPSIPAPPQPNSIVSNTNDQIQSSQKELKRLIDTESGISQIHNPFLRTLGHIGEIGAQLFIPNEASLIPGTQQHHNQLINDQEALISRGTDQASKEASTAHENQETQTLADAPDKDLKEFDVWVKQNPNVPISKYWEQKAATSNGKLSPDSKTMQYLTSLPEQGGLGLPVDQAYIKLQEMKAESKPNTAAQDEADIEKLLAKTFPTGAMDPKVMSDPTSLISHISNSNLTPEEKAKVFGHLTAKTSPASQGGIANTRLQGMLSGRLTGAIDNSTGNLALITPAQVAASPGRFIPAAQGVQSMSKEQLFEDIKYNARNLRSALSNLRNGFTPGARAQIALMLSSSNPHSALDSFMKSETASTLTPDQIDYVTALASMNENAMILRSLGGMGQGSDEMRAAIKATLPGAQTPSLDYANRQMDLFEGTVKRIEQGVAHSGVSHPDTENKSATPSTQGKTFTRKQVEDAAKAAGISYEDAKADAEKHHHKVVD